MDEPHYTKHETRNLNFTEYQNKVEEIRSNKELSRLQKDLMIRKLEKAKTNGQSIF